MISWIKKLFAKKKVESKVELPSDSAYPRYPQPDWNSPSTMFTKKEYLPGKIYPRETPRDEDDSADLAMAMITGGIIGAALSSNYDNDSSDSSSTSWEGGGGDFSGGGASGTWDDSSSPSSSDSSSSGSAD